MDCGWGNRLLELGTQVFNSPRHNHDPLDERVEIVCALRAVGRGCPWGKSRVVVSAFNPHKNAKVNGNHHNPLYKKSVMILLDMKILGAIIKDSELGLFLG